MKTKYYNLSRLKLCLFFSLLLVIGCSKDNPSETISDNNDDTGTVGDGDGNNNLQGFTGTIDWLKTLGGTAIEQAVSAVITTDGNIAVLAYTNSVGGDIPTTKQTTDLDLWLLKLTPQGNILWSKIYGDLEDEVATKINNTTDGGFIVSGYSRSNNCSPDSNSGFHDYWLLKLDNNGNQQWCKNYGFAGSDQAFDVFQTSDGGYFASGFLDVTASGGLGNDDRNPQPEHGVGEFWVIKMDANGDFIWRRYFGGTNNDRSYDAIQTPDGGFLVVGASESTDFDIIDKKGSYDFWVVKVSANGDKQWTKSYGGTEIDGAFEITTSNDGNYFIAGDTRSTDLDVTNPLGGGDFWIIKIAPNGNLLNQKSFGGSQFESARSIKNISSNRLLISGSTRSNNNNVTENKGENDAWVIIVDQNLNLQFQKTIGGSNFDFADDAIELPDGSIIMIGNTESNNGDIITNKGSKDVLICKIK